MSSSGQGLDTGPQAEHFVQSPLHSAHFSEASSSLDPGSSTDSEDYEEKALTSDDEVEAADGSEELDPDFVVSNIDPVTGEEKDYNRPNRFRGPISTWRNWTEQDRVIVESLDRERAQDLSVHLYNAYVLRSGARHSQQDGSLAKKQRDESTASTGGQGDVFPSSIWTAWPLPSTQMPLETFRPTLGGLQDVTENAQEDPRTSLTESLIAEMTRIARKRFESREWESLNSPAAQSGLSGDGDQNADNQMKLEMAETENSDDAEDSQGAPRFRSQRARDGAKESAHHSDMPTDVKKPKHFDAQLPISARPGPITDDARARQILQPSADHILMRLDELLMALHKARRAYADPATPRESSWGSTAESSIFDSSDSPERGEHRGRKRKRNSSTAGSVSSPTSRASLSQKPRRTRLLLPRDWSDVLGMAALSGWDDAVIERAGRRCVAMFKENMMFRTFHEGTADESPHFTEQLATGKEPEAGGAEEENELTTEPDDGLTDADIRIPVSDKCCPFPWCDRHTKPFEKRRNVKRHVDYFHATEDLTSITTFDQLPQRPAEEVQGLFCPDPDCKRAGQEFASQRKLRRHIRRVHPEIDTKDTRVLQHIGRTGSRGRSSSRAKSPLPSRFCPVESCPRHTQPFRDSRDMYRHVQSVHRDVNVTNLKRQYGRRAPTTTSSGRLENELQSDGNSKGVVSSADERQDLSH